MTDDGTIPTDIVKENGTLLIYTKGDITGVEGAVSAKTGLGIKELVDKLTSILNEKVSGIGVATRARHKAALISAIHNIEQAKEKIDNGTENIELVAEDVRRSILSLDSLIGKVGVEDVLDEIFLSFCLGK